MHVTCIEVDKFKSFGSYTRIPLLEGFTVVSGPNGSGKSNIIDSLLFALGLSDSRGLRAGKLSDLIHQGVTRGEAVVTVTLGGGDETLTITRRLRVNGANYTSTYLLNSRVCTLTELHEQLAQHRIYPQGYNVVLQGDVTDIISMNARERREIIDELAGVAEFDRKITLARRELTGVEEQEERLRFVAAELEQARERLSQERTKAQEYKSLRTQFDRLQIQLERLTLQQLETRLAEGRTQIEHFAQQIQSCHAQAQEQHEELTGSEAQLSLWQKKVKQLGEEEQIALQGEITALRLRREQIQQQQTELTRNRAKNRDQVQQLLQEETKLAQQQEHQQTERTRLLAHLEATRVRLTEQQQRLEGHREQLRVLSQSSEAWVQQQTQLNQHLQHLQATLTPLQQTLTRLAERLVQQRQQISESEQECQLLSTNHQTQQAALSAQSQIVAQHAQGFEELRNQLKERQGALLTDKSTLRRLEKEQQHLHRELDQLEARQQASRELEGHTALQSVMRARLAGVHGPVVHLAQCPAEYQLALELAAGGRLFNIVVEDDGVASQAIELLKLQRAGRATFLPLNQLRDPYTLAPLREPGAVGYAVELLDFDPLYRRVFAYVFGDTVIWDTLEHARRYLGRYRMVTLGGELLEKSGAMTGGFLQSRSTGSAWRSTPAPEPLTGHRTRLSDLDRMIQSLTDKLEAQEREVQQLQQEVQKAERQSLYSAGREQQLQSEVQRLSHRHTQIQQHLAHLLEQHQQDRSAQDRAQVQLAPLEDQLTQTRDQLSGLTTYSVYQEWQHLQQMVNDQDRERQQLQSLVFQQESQLQKVEASLQLGRERQGDLSGQLQIARTQSQTCEANLIHLEEQNQAHQTQQARVEEQWTRLEERLQAAKAQRDHWEETVTRTRRQIQEIHWQAEQLQERQQTQQAALGGLQEQILQQQIVCAALEEVPLTQELTLEQVQQQRQRIQRRLTALEPVNMLAIEEYDQTEERLKDLSERLSVLTRERTALLLRIEDLDTLKQEAFLGAFEAVNGHFQSIFAGLSDGEGHLQLEDPEHPFSGGLTLVAHPKGKKVRRLESMSGGEKSLTALSFIFALQRYRPSPFYAFDEVDMFLDGANVERLAHILQQEAQAAQFLVVSLRRPMIERADRTIGVTLGRNQQSQVLGLKKPLGNGMFLRGDPRALALPQQE
ncbi:chromosome segregation protein SMC [Anthocerotibacter panamensis]|uniref:chromosome segregation protein SMC n=1 Tax=Anthocerotibacter panamensis TaxID=2857077 RepID=UPI001C4066A2|nr:chromosome segregation protein SMC [Anthocerotibacter panamensis]